MRSLWGCLPGPLGSPARGRAGCLQPSSLCDCSCNTWLQQLQPGSSAGNTSVHSAPGRALHLPKHGCGVVLVPVVAPQTPQWKQPLRARGSGQRRYSKPCCTDVQHLPGVYHALGPFSALLPGPASQGGTKGQTARCCKHHNCLTKAAASLILGPLPMPTAQRPTS